MEIKKFKDIEAHVIKALESNPETRDSDTALYLVICSTVNRDACRLPFWDVIARYKDLGLPKFESVGRIRRKVQTMRPDLRAKEAVINGRYEEWKIYREYAAQ